MPCSESSFIAVKCNSPHVHGTSATFHIYLRAKAPYFHFYGVSIAMQARYIVPRQRKQVEGLKKGSKEEVERPRNKWVEGILTVFDRIDF